jgi:hypothetical protein
MNGLEEVGARVRVDKLKPWNYSPKAPFPSNPRWLRRLANRLMNPFTELTAKAYDCCLASICAAFGSTWLGNTYQIAPATCKPSRIAHVVRCAVAG